MDLFDAAARGPIIDRIKGLTPEHKALWGKMSVDQMLCHTSDQLRVALGDIRRERGKASLIKRTLIKWLALYVLPIPKNVPTLPEADQARGGGTKPTNFEADKNLLLEYIEKFAAAPDDFVWGYHGLFAGLDRKEWGILAYKHLVHHLGQFGA